MLNDLIVIEKRKKVQNESAFDEYQWEKEYTCWADREAITSEEHYSGHSYRTKTISTYKIRNSSKVESIDTSAYRVSHKGKSMEIISIIADGKRDEYLKLKCEMVS